jgi:hypothetical protein
VVIVGFSAKWYNATAPRCTADASDSLLFQTLSTQTGFRPMKHGMVGALNFRCHVPSEPSWGLAIEGQSGVLIG